MNTLPGCTCCSLCSSGAQDVRVRVTVIEQRVFEPLLSLSVRNVLRVCSENIAFLAACRRACVGFLWCGGAVVDVGREGGGRGGGHPRIPAWLCGCVKNPSLLCVTLAQITPSWPAAVGSVRSVDVDRTGAPTGAPPYSPWRSGNVLSHSSNKQPPVDGAIIYMRVSPTIWCTRH